jgi:hypothetical protein
MIYGIILVQLLSRDFNRHIYSINIKILKVVLVGNTYEGFT